MSRVIRIELRRSAALGTALVLLLAGVGILWYARSGWSSGWMSMAMSQRQYLILVLPLALAGGAWQARREHTSRVAELFASTPRPRRQRVTPLLVVFALAVTLVYPLTTVIAGTWIAGTARYLPADAFAVVAVGVLAAVGAAWLGMAVGRLVPLLVTAPALAVAGVVVLTLIYHVVGKRDWLAMLLSPTHGMGLYTDYQTVPVRVSAAQALWLAALAVAAAMLLAADRWQSRAASVLPVPLGLAAGLLVIPHGADFAENPTDPVAKELVCTETRPQVCVSRVHRGLLPEIEPLARHGLTLLARLPNAPATAVEDTFTYFGAPEPPQRPGTVLLDVRVGRDGHLADKDAFVFQMLYAAGVRRPDCPEPTDPAVATAAAFWLEGRGHVDPLTSDEVQVRAEQLWQGLRLLPEHEAAARVAAVRDAAFACQDAGHLLDGLA